MVNWSERRHRIPRMSCGTLNSRRKCSRWIAHFRRCCDGDTWCHRPPKRIRCRGVGTVRSTGGRVGRHISAVPMRSFSHVAVACCWSRTSCSGGSGGNPWLVHGRSRRRRIRAHCGWDGMHSRQWWYRWYRGRPTVERTVCRNGRVFFQSCRVRVCRCLRAHPAERWGVFGP